MSMDNPKVAFGNVIGIIVLYIFGGSTLALIPAIFALIFGIKGVKQKKLEKKDKIASITGIVAGAGYIVYAVLGGLLLYYF